jgi:hypothetical protein
VVEKDQDSVEYWRDRAGQLEHALTSRIAIEQAKGVLVERFAVSPDVAFELLRVGARSAQLKLHALAASVVASRDTPPEIVAAVARHRELIERVPQEERIRQTEVFFRALNEEILRVGTDSGFDVVCECGNPLCTQRMSISPSTLHALYSQPNLFLVLPGHEIPEVESVVDEIDGYLVVQKD